MLSSFSSGTTAKSGKIRQQIHFGHEPKTEGFGSGGIVGGDERHDFPEIIARLKRPDYFVSHVASCRLTSSCDTVSPRSI